MKIIYCDICKKKIEAHDIPTSLDLNVGGKNISIDMHSACYYKFVRALRDVMEEGETYTAESKNIT